MSKYYRVRTQEQWDWLKNKLEIKGDLHVSYFPVTILDGDIFCGIYKYHDDPEPLIEVSQMMEESRMEDYVTIKGEDLIKIKSSLDLESYIHELNIPKSLLYPKIQFTEAEKKEFDSIDNDETLSNALDIIELEDYPNLYGRIYYHTVPEYQKFELEFARAWADPSLIEVIPEQKWNVRVPKLKNMFYWKNDDETLDYQDSQYNCYHHQQFTAEELKHYGLDNDLFEKVEVSE